MTEQPTDDRITVKAAAEFLGVATKTIHRYIARGSLSKIKEGSRTYLYHSELTEISNQSSFKRDQTKSRSGRISGAGQMLDHVILQRERYESLLIELGELRKQSQFLVEFRGVLQTKDDAIKDRDKEISRLNTEIDRVLLKDKELEIKLSESIAKCAELEAELDRLKTLKQWWQR
ncbi:MAG: helix-turn-helix domain-containing protein [Syntrophobacteraceae bacterium]